ncbi:MAG: hypothetical protein KDB47_04755 [Mycobacterium sp.]|nr:hypothetical protein [Mycobacterium sp.]
MAVVTGIGAVLVTVVTVAAVGDDEGALVVAHPLEVRATAMRVAAMRKAGVSTMSPP